MPPDISSISRHSSVPRRWDATASAVCGAIFGFLAAVGYQGYVIFADKCSEIDPFLRFFTELSGASISGGLLFYAVAAARNRTMQR
jgi:TRAP-type C4-dicarboxylate transport system permease small subunit